MVINYYELLWNKTIQEIIISVFYNIQPIPYIEPSYHWKKQSSRKICETMMQFNRIFTKKYRSYNKGVL